MSGFSPTAFAQTGRGESADERAFVASALLGRAGMDGIVVTSVPAPLADPATLLALFPDEPAVAWSPPRGPSFAGIGEAFRVDLEGEDRFRRLRSEVSGLWSQIESVASTPSAPEPRLFGGLAFAVGGAAEAPWADFGDGSFVLPRWTYRREGNRAWLSLAVRCSDLGDGGGDARVTRLLAELEELLDVLRGPPSLPHRIPETDRVEHLPADRFGAEIEAIRAAIAHGTVDKVVAARRSVVRLSGELDPVTVFARLRNVFPECTCFAIRRRTGTFVGATPERLVSRRDRRVDTEALAGSIRPGGQRAARELLASKKDREEHDYVVRQIVERLAPLCDELGHPSEPAVRELPHVLHMCTTVRGLLHEDTDVVDLVEALHPTPAVGGVPAERALSWIVAHESAPRGWYSGPVGWIDARGDGELVVALRSGLLHGRVAWVYAGGGIVRDSEPVAEYAETGLKLRALLGALGCEAEDACDADSDEVPARPVTGAVERGHPA